MADSVTTRLRRILPVRTIVRVAAARIGATLARTRPIRERVYIVANRDGALRGNLAEIERALTTRPMAPTILRETGSARERQGGLPLIGLLAAVVRIARRSYRVASSRVVIVDDYFFPIYPVKKRSGVTIIQVWHACGAFKRFGRATLESEWGADEIFLRWVPIHSNYDLTLVSSASIAPIYADDLPLAKKIERIATQIYGADGVDIAPAAAKRRKDTPIIAITSSGSAIRHHPLTAISVA